VNPKTGIGVYTQAPIGSQAPVSGLGVVLRFFGITEIGAFGHNLFLLGSNVGSHNVFGELAPLNAFSTFTLS
jgi:hypothetical protein